MLAGIDLQIDIVQHHGLAARHVDMLHLQKHFSVRQPIISSKTGHKAQQKQQEKTIPHAEQVWR
jgi:hypothetical protein